MLRLVTFLTTFLMCCGVGIDPLAEKLPVWEGRAEQICEAALCPPAGSTAQALLVVDRAWRRTFPKQCEIMQRITIVWHEADGCPRGCTGEGDRYDPSKVHIYHGVDFVAGSALVHELEHPCAKEQFRNADDEHELAGLWDDPDNNARSIERDAQREIIRAGL